MVMVYGMKGKLPLTTFKMGVFGCITHKVI